MDWRKIKALKEQIGEHRASAEAILNKASAEKRDLTPDEHRQIGDLDGKIMQARIDVRILETQPVSREQETFLSSHFGPDGELRSTAVTPLVLSYRSFLQGGVNAMSADQRAIHDRIVTEMSEADQKEFRALTTQVGSAGSLVPGEVLGTIDDARKFSGGMLQICDFIDTDHGRDVSIPTSNDTENTGEITAEDADVSEDDEPTIGEAKLGAFVFDSGIEKVTIQLLQDSIVPPEQFVTAQLERRVLRKANTALTTGTGTGEPEGVVTAVDPGVTAASPTELTAAELLALVHSVDREYRQSPKAAFMFNDSTLEYLRNFVDETGRSLFRAGGLNSGIEAGAPETVLGYRYVVNNDMPDISAGAKSVLFGDFSKYKVRRVKQMFVFRLDQLYVKKLQVGFMAFQRFDGKLVDAGTGPIKALQHAAS